LFYVHRLPVLSFPTRRSSDLFRTVMRFVMSFFVEVIYRPTVGDHHTLKAPFVPQDIHQESITSTTRLSLERIIGTHHFLHIPFLYQCFEGGKIGFPEVTVGNNRVIGMAVPFRSTMHRIMLGTGMRFKISIVVSL